jgi:hypothetical protein
MKDFSELYKDDKKFLGGLYYAERTLISEQVDLIQESIQNREEYFVNTSSELARHLVESELTKPEYLAAMNEVYDSLHEMAQHKAFLEEKLRTEIVL